MSEQGSTPASASHRPRTLFPNAATRKAGDSPSPCGGASEA